MKRHIPLLLLALLLFIGCGQKVIAPAPERQASVPTASAASTPTFATETPAPTQTPPPALPTYPPRQEAEALFPEELLSHDGEPVASEIGALLAEKDLQKSVFYERFRRIIDNIEGLDRCLLDLAAAGRTLTEDRRDGTAESLNGLLSDRMLQGIRDAYARCLGEGQELPVKEYATALAALCQDVERTEGRTVPFFGLGQDAAKGYLTVLDRYMGETIAPQQTFDTLERLMETEAFALSAALEGDPEAAHKKVPVTLGSYSKNMAFLCRVTDALCPLPSGGGLPIPPEPQGASEMELPELAFRLYPGMAFLKAYMAQCPQEQQERWDNAPDGYLAGVAVHCSHAVLPYLEEFGLDYVQYRWYVEMLSTTMTGMTALLIHYYGYSMEDLAAYLDGWGAKAYAGYLYGKAMSDPFESLVASLGYMRYLDISQAAADAGCDDDARFLQAYLSVGPAPFEALKEYMVRLYQKEG